MKTSALNNTRGAESTAISDVLRKSVQFLRERNVPLPQDFVEFTMLMQLVSMYRPKVFLEVGTRDGGSLWSLAQCCDPAACIISVDLPGAKWGWDISVRGKGIVCEDLRDRGFEVHEIEDDSQLHETRDEVVALLDGREVGLLFIDADHTYDGVKRDWELYQPLVAESGLTAFHDIVLDPIKLPEVEVGRLWNEIRGQFVYWEFVNLFGIGVIKNQDRQYG